ncbi:hypothetical protein [Streptomyces europaeiscabiei]|uniref:hypothetical protein n=1 Tax=Streptomyces europaeiscabiei TaxID=146819 RepID=UPI002E267FBF|nr:hypothetical protein OG858_47960 [Streptomyces europaeiscabiei]
MTDTSTVTEQTDDSPAEPDNTIARFLTLGGAVVRMYPTRFITRWAGGPPFAAAKRYEINGFQWECDGCGAYGREGDTYKDPNYRTQSEARTEANEHADSCRAMPKPPTAV